MSSSQFTSSQSGWWEPSLLSGMLTQSLIFYFNIIFRLRTTCHPLLVAPLAWLVSIPPALMSLTTAGILIPSLGKYVEVAGFVSSDSPVVHLIFSGVVGDCPQFGSSQVHRFHNHTLWGPGVNSQLLQREQDSLAYWITTNSMLDTMQETSCDFVKIVSGSIHTGLALLLQGINSCN